MQLVAKGPFLSLFQGKKGLWGGKKRFGAPGQKSSKKEKHWGARAQKPPIGRIWGPIWAWPKNGFFIAKGNAVLK
jgi:hypothetical protein